MVLVLEGEHDRLTCSMLHWMRGSNRLVWSIVTYSRVRIKEMRSYFSGMH